MAAVLEIQNQEPVPADQAPSVKSFGGVQRASVSTEPPPTKESAENGGADQPKPGDRPAWLPEKFKSAEDMAKAYGELEKKLGQSKAPAAAPPKAGVQPSDAGAGFSFDALTAEYAKDGKLSEASLKALSDRGIPESTVSAFIEGQKAVATARNARLADSVGGQETLDSMFEWAKANLSQAEIDAANKALRGTEDEAKLALAGLKSAFSTASGKDPEPVKGRATPNQADAPPFESNTQVSDAMRDPRYAKDPAYRAKVIARLANTPAFGNHRY